MENVINLTALLAQGWLGRDGICCTHTKILRFFSFIVNGNVCFHSIPYKKCFVQFNSLSGVTKIKSAL